jgi:predicted small lipoprotein YifL
LPFVPAQNQSFDVSSFGRAVLLAALVGLAVAGCGRRGPLEPPPGARNGVEYPEDKETQVEAEADSPVFNTSPAGRPAKASKVIVPPKRSFILDPLL